MKQKKKVVMLVGGPTLPSDMVIGLMRVGFAVEWVSTGGEAMERIDRQGSGYDALVITTQLNNKEQQDLACSVRNIVSYYDLFIVCLSDDVGRTKGPVYTRIPNTVNELQWTLADEFVAQAARATSL